MLFFVLCTYTQRPYEVVILDRAGRVVDSPTNLAYNLYLCSPIDKVVRIDTRLHLFQGTLTEINTKGKEPIMVQIFAAWKIKDPKVFYSNLRGSDELAIAFIGQKITGDVASVIGQYNLEELYNTDDTQVNMNKIEDEIIQHANVQETTVTAGKGADAGAVHVPGLLSQGLEVDQVGFSRFAFPPSVAQSVYERMTAERTKQATDYRTQGDSEFSKLQAEGQQEAQQIRSKAEADAQKIRGEGAAAAIQILADVQQDSETRDFYRFWKNMELLNKSMTQRSYFIMTPEDPLFAPIYKFARQGSTPANFPPSAPPK